MKLRFVCTPLRALIVCSVALLQSLAWPVLAESQTLELTAVLRGASVPRSIRASELTPEWQRFTTGTSQSDLRALLARDGLSKALPYYTRGQMVSAGGETYLVTYRQAIDALIERWSTRAASTQPTTSNNAATQLEDLDDGLDSDTTLGILEAAARHDPKMRMRADEELVLSLLNLRGIGAFKEIRGFDSQRDILSEEDAKQEAIQKASLQSERNLEQIGLGLRMYVQDYDELYPPMRSVQSKAEITAPMGKLVTVQQALRPYVKSIDIFSHPITRELYQPNPALSGVSYWSVRDSAQVVAFWEKSPAPDGRRAVLYVNGAVKHVPESNWRALLAMSNAIMPPRDWSSTTRRSRLDEAIAISRIVSSAFYADAALKTKHISVASYDKDIALDGYVSNAAQKVRAETLARKHAPGYRIINRLEFGDE